VARYRKIDVRIWGDAKFRELSPLQPSGQALWLYLLTNPETTMVPGAMRLGEAGIAEALGWHLEAFREAFREASTKGLVEADWGARFVWVRNAVKYNPPASPNVIKGLVAHWDELPECELKNKALQDFSRHISTMSKAFREAFREAFPKGFPKALSNQEQEQEQEQEQNLPPKPPTREPSPEVPPGPELMGGGGGCFGLSKALACSSPGSAPDASVGPDPAPVPVTPSKVDETGCSDLMAGNTPKLGPVDLDVIPDMAPLRGAEVEQLISEAGLSGPVGAGIGGLRRTVELVPIHAWELRRALGAAKESGIRRSVDGFLASVIRGLRERGERPPPRAALGDCRSTPGPARTVAERSKGYRAEWASAAAAAGLPPPGEDRLEKWSYYGGPGPDDIKMLLSSGGSWARYDEESERVRVEAMESLGMALNSHAVD
jgi:hypothetical protein